MSVKPMARACTRPRSTSRSFTHFWRSLSPVPAQVQLQHRQLLRHQASECPFAQLLLEPVERRAGQHLSLQAVGRGPPGAGADAEVDPADLGQGTEKLLDDGLSQEAGGAGD